MVLMGTIVNAACIALGSITGKLLNRVPEGMKTTVMNGISLAVILLGLQMGLASKNFLIVILSIVIGAVLGEWWKLDDKLNSVGGWLENKIGGKEDSSIAQGFVTATLIFLIGAMAILGSLDSGIRGDHHVLYTKAILDGFMALLLTTTFGIGVIFSIIPVVLYQGAITLFATQIDKFVPEQMMTSFIAEMTGTGGLMIVAIGLNLLGVTKIKAANLLPGILVVAVIVWITEMFG